MLQKNHQQNLKQQKQPKNARIDGEYIQNLHQTNEDRTSNLPVRYDRGNVRQGSLYPASYYAEIHNQHMMQMEKIQSTKTEYK